MLDEFFIALLSLLSLRDQPESNQTLPPWKDIHTGYTPLNPTLSNSLDGEGGVRGRAFSYTTVALRPSTLF